MRVMINGSSLRFTDTDIDPCYEFIFYGFLFSNKTLQAKCEDDPGCVLYHLSPLLASGVWVESGDTVEEGESTWKWDCYSVWK